MFGIKTLSALLVVICFSQVSVAEETWGLKRPMNKKWVESLEQQCKDQKVEFVMNEFLSNHVSLKDSLYRLSD